jgi:ubiquinone/menaquinone biosynthesis C-methylase UbiE
MLHSFMHEYVGMGQAVDLLARTLAEVPDVSTLLDVGCGYGSFVLAARSHGLDAVGVDLAEFELEFARSRLSEQRPDDDPQAVYLQSSGLTLPFPSGSFSAVTAWNVLEHVADLSGLLGEVRRVLRPGGTFLAVAPNYAAVRTEAHYHVFWPPLLPRGLASRYLRRRGKDPAFFETSIFYRTNGEVRRALRAAGFEVGTPQHQLAKLRALDSIRRPMVRRVLAAAARAHVSDVVEAVVAAQYRNPLRAQIDVHARVPRT